MSKRVAGSEIHIHSNAPRRAWRGAGALLAALALLAGCGSTPTTTVRSTATTIPTPTATVPATTEGHLTLLSRQAVGSAAKQITVSYSESSKVATVDATLIWYPSWRDHFSLAQVASKLACYKIQAALWTSGVPLSKVIVIVLGQALDDYASVITSAYAEADIDSAHASAITWSAISPDQAWALYDNNFLRPTYAPNWVYLAGQH
jgi:hypothetical protein